MKTSDSGVEFIKSFEGYSAIPYKDIAGRWTIGFGHKMQPREPHMAISCVEALTLLREDIAEKETAINDNLKVEVTQNQFDALVDFTYNLGSNNFINSTLLRLLNEGDTEEASQEFPRWCHALVGGKMVVVPALQRRREAEQQLFLGEYDATKTGKIEEDC